MRRGSCKLACLLFAFLFFVSIIFLFLSSLDSIAAESSPSSIKSVSISREFFNPSLGQTVEISVILTHPGLLSVKILDRDGYPVTTLASDKKSQVGKTTFLWKGDGSEGIVPNEAYSVWIELKVGNKKDHYFPANQPLTEEKAELGYYDRKRAVISFRLQKPSRVHLQTGVAVVDPVSKKVEGPVMATVLNREPRSSGWIAEYWNGFADSDSRIYVPDLPNFKLAVAATALPENSIIATGNRNQTFLEYATNRKGNSLFTYKAPEHHHHQGLTSLDDASPSLSLRPQNASWSEKEQTWTLQASQLKIRGRLSGESAASFSKQPGYLVLFVDGREIQKIMQPCSHDFEIEVPRNSLVAGTQIISANCASEYGPTAVFSLRLKKEDSAAKTSPEEQHETAN
jgi:hypothetical protein